MEMGGEMIGGGVMNNQTKTAAVKKGNAVADSKKKWMRRI